MVKDEMEKKIGAKISNEAYWNFIVGLSDWPCPAEISKELDRYWILRNDKYLSKKTIDYILEHSSWLRTRSSSVGGISDGK